MIENQMLSGGAAPEPGPEQAGVGVHTVFVTNNAYDTILLVDGNDRVLSAWLANRVVIVSYISTGCDGYIFTPGYWSPEFDVRSEEDISDDLRIIASYGREAGRDGVINDDSRREFWLSHGDLPDPEPGHRITPWLIMSRSRESARAQERLENNND